MRSWERQYRKGVGAEGLRVEANFSNEGFPGKGDQGSLKHRGWPKLLTRGSHLQELEKLPRSGLDEGNEKESTIPPMRRAPGRWRSRDRTGELTQMHHSRIRH